MIPLLVHLPPTTLPPLPPLPWLSLSPSLTLLSNSLPLLPPSSPSSVLDPSLHLPTFAGTGCEDEGAIAIAEALKEGERKAAVGIEISFLVREVLIEGGVDLD